MDAHHKKIQEEIEKRERARLTMDGMDKDRFQYNIHREKLFNKHYNQCLRLARQFVNTYRQFHFDFLTKTVRHKLNYIDRWRSNAELKANIRPYMQEIESIESKIKDLGDNARRFLLVAFMDNFNNQLSKFDIRHLIDPQERVDLINRTNDVRYFIDDTHMIIFSYYKNNIRKKDIFLDPQFILLHILKAANIGVFFFSLWYSERKFLEMYNLNVYDKVVLPPKLFWFPFILLGLHAFSNVTIFFCLWALKYMYKRNTKQFIVDSFILRSYVIDFIVSTIFIFTLAFLTSAVIQNKTYFRYSTEGARAIRILRQIILVLYAIFIFVPFYHYI